ncbi:cupin domain-containing protein [Pinibacter aurantiacus]|uniref:Cupin domain-containing protein n=1 Tax=Pinibacter aurantiacus TaxID=2851599 RepID=A0A9E2W6W8_9BACT|nr:cupin domain-containing protein [Pinibacter aurantiacus]MBV4360514.1 cupin domain-containing protein [Pinibacter aurantiacus]
MEKVIIEEKLTLFSEYWSPKIVGELNGQHVKLAKFKGAFVWHKHDNEDEMFLVVDGVLKMEFRDKTIEISKNEFLIVPKGIEHRPYAENEVAVLLFEPATTLNTGDKENEWTKRNIDSI